MIKQIFYELRQNPLVTWVTVSGTALSVFLVMAVYMVGQIDTVAVAPESNRPQMLVAPFGHIKNPYGDSSGSMSTETAIKLYGDIDGVEEISLYRTWTPSLDVNVPGASTYSLEAKMTDDVYWKIFDFQFICGRPFTTAEVAADAKVAVLPESSARLLFGSTDVAGREIMVTHIPYKVIGVVKDSNPILKNTAARLYLPWKESPNQVWQTYLGSTGVYMLMSDGSRTDDVKKEVRRRYEVFNKTLSRDSLELIYHGTPYTPEEMAMDFGSNTEPNVNASRRSRYIVFAILLLVPAINLSGMTRSRLKQRVSEIGIRRAYGAKRHQIAVQFIGENFLLTLFGGAIGLLLCILFLLFFSNLFVNYFLWYDYGTDTVSARPTFSMLFTWGMFGFALLFSFILNLLSTGIPAFRASRVNPAEAIGGHNI